MLSVAFAYLLKLNHWIIQLKSSDCLSHHGVWCTCHWFNCTCHCFYKSVKVTKNSWYFVGVFKKTIIPLAFVGYEMIIANSAPHWLSTISYPKRPCGIIVICDWKSLLNILQNYSVCCFPCHFTMSSSKWYHVSINFLKPSI